MIMNPKHLLYIFKSLHDKLASIIHINEFSSYLTLGNPKLRRKSGLFKRSRPLIRYSQLCKYFAKVRKVLFETPQPEIIRFLF